MLLAIVALFTALSSVQCADPGSVAFSVCQTEDTVYEEGSVVKYNSVFTNIGGAYSTATGKFIASEDGVYVFHVFAMSKSTEEFRICLNLNNACQHAAAGKSTSSYLMGGNTMVLSLYQYDTICIKAMARSELHSGAGNVYSTFTGYLIY